MLFKKLLNFIYDSEINCRIEWFWDAGFTWSIQGCGVYPRILIDDDTDGATEVISSVSKEQNRLPKKDWIARGSNEDIDYALCELFDAIIKHLPESTAAKKLKDFDENREHFIVCQKCGDLMDCRDLGDVFSHEHDEDLPKVDGSKYTSIKKGDSKEWRNGKGFNLN